MSTVQTAASQCGPTCATTPQCTHISWTPPSNCYLKQVNVSQSDAIVSNAPGIICALHLSGPNPPPGPPPNSSYTLVQNYSPDGFVSGSDWDFFTAHDPTNGFVTYVDRNTAANAGILKIGTSGSGQRYAFLGSGSTGSAPISIRVASKRTFSGGLVLWDALHIPTGCGTWPAFWSTSDNGWPQFGEIDVMEGVNGVGSNAMTLHTSAGCTVPPNLNCNAGDAHNGCGFRAAPSSGTFGSSFNNNPGGGGIYAMEWIPNNQGGIKIWSFPRNEIPADILAGRPNPPTWRTDTGFAKFPFGNNCPSNHFVNHKIIIDLTFCGDWAGQTFGNDCRNIGKSCNDYLNGNKGALSDAFYQMLSVKLYQK